MVSNHNPSIYTTEILCKYCGYISPDELIKSTHKLFTDKLTDQQLFLQYLVKVFVSMPEIAKRNENGDTFPACLPYEPRAAGLVRPQAYAGN